MLMIKWVGICLIILFLIFDVCIIVCMIQDLMDYLKRRNGKQ